MVLPTRLLPCPLACALLLTGCAHPVISKRDLTPLYDEYGQARSLSLTSPMVQAAQLYPPGFEHWYETRNDLVPTVQSGYEAQTYEQSVTYTRDRRTTVNGRVRDQYIESTYRRTYREQAR